jgi:hypothetical protein
VGASKRQAPLSGIKKKFSREGFWNRAVDAEGRVVGGLVQTVVLGAVL